MFFNKYQVKRRQRPHITHKALSTAKSKQPCSAVLLAPELIPSFFQDHFHGFVVGTKKRERSLLWELLAGGGAAFGVLGFEDRQGHLTKDPPFGW